MPREGSARTGQRVAVLLQFAEVTPRCRADTTKTERSSFHVVGGWPGGRIATKNENHIAKDNITVLGELVGGLGSEHGFDVLGFIRVS